MGLFKYLNKAHKERSKEYNELVRTRLIDWRKETTPLRIEHPTDLISAKRLGYKSKKGFILSRVRVPRGQKQRPSIRHGRRSAHMRQRLVLKKSYQIVAEQRANKAYPNLEILNSYKVGQDGLHYWYEIILVDPKSPQINADSALSWINNGKNRKRAFRGLTSAGKKSRGMLGKGQGHEKVRPSLGSHQNRAK